MNVIHLYVKSKGKIKMKKIITLLLALIITLSFTGCELDEYSDDISSEFDFGYESSEEESLIDEYLSQEEVSEQASTDEVSSDDASVSESNSISAPISYSYSGEYDAAVEKFKNAGFKNVKTKASYEVGTGFFASLSLNSVKTISIDGKTNFSSGDRFDKDVPIIITYKEYEFKNPDIKFTSYTVAKMLKDVESNELTAEEKYNGKYVAVKGRVDGIDDSGDFNLYPTNDSWAIIGVTCELLVDEQKEQVKKLKKGQVITVKGKITYVSDLLGYSMEVYSIG